MFNLIPKEVRFFEYFGDARAKAHAIKEVESVDTTNGQLASRKEKNMLWSIFVILMIMWLLGLVSGYTIGGFIHILLVIAIVAVLIRIIQGRSPL